MMTALEYALQVLNALPQLIAAGVEITAMATQARDRLQAMKDENREPTPAEWNELNDEIARLRGQLHAP
jgi:hypothetical protein